MQRTASNETTLVSEIANIINDKYIIIASGQRKISAISSDEFCKVKHFRIFFLRVNLSIMLLEIF